MAKTRQVGITPELSVKCVAAQSIPANGAITKRTFDTVTIDTKGWWASNKYTPLEAGNYLVSYFDGMLNSSGGANYFSIYVYKNGSAIAQARTVFVANGYDNTITIPPLLIPMNGTTDYLEFYIAQTHTSAMNTSTFVSNIVTITKAID